MSKKLLLADDSITIQKVIGITFANEDFVLTIVDNGNDALEKARADRPDLILADVFMPGKDGYELSAAIKQDPVLKDVPVLLLAGTFEPFDEGKARASGADNWISKPFESQALIDQVESLLAKAPAPSAPRPVEPSPVVPPPTPPVVEEISPPQEEEIWGESFVAGAAEGEEDFWGSATFEEEELGEELPELPPVEGFDSWETEESLPAETEAPDASAWEGGGDVFEFEEEEESAAPSPPLEEIGGFESELTLGVETDATSFDALESEEWEEPEEEVFALEEADILEEEELDVVSAPISTPPPVVEEEETSFADVDALEWEEEEVPVEAEASFAFPEEEPLPAEETISWEEPAEEAFEAPVTSVPEPAVPVAPAATAAMPSVSLSEEAIAGIVEKTAGAVIEKIAGTILEKIAWEVVPDLAESLIKEEIRKIREEAK